MATKNRTIKKDVSKGMNFQYAPAEESTQMIKLDKKQKLFINGEFIIPKSGKYFDTHNPATGEILSKIAIANKEDIDYAVKSARNAYEKTWSKVSGIERGKYLFKIARILQERAKEFSILETLDNGKPIKESRDIDIPLVSHHFFYHAGWADKTQYLMPGKKLKSLGVCAQIIPWNFPLLMAAWKIAPALAAGNTVILKPAEQTSLTALLLAEVFQEANLPAGVVNIITGAAQTGAQLVSHPDINKIAFTGSTDIGKSIAKNIAKTDKKLSLELGGKSANIIFADAAIDQAIEGVINSIYFNQGHVCCAGSRLLVEESILPIILKKLKRRMSQIRVGNPLDKNTDMGAINSKEQLTKIQELVNEAIKSGAEYYRSSCELPKNGNFFAPMFFYGLSNSHRLNREEIFGPVLSISTFRTPEEAVAKANDTPFGLAAGIWSEKSSKIHWTASQLQAGIIWANTYNKFDPSSPFGGFKESGYGREGGRHGMLSYMEVVK